MHKNLTAAKRTVKVALVSLVAGMVVTGIASAHTPLEDEIGFDCRTQGNHICGPANQDGITPGLYRNGVILELWDHNKHYGVKPGTEYDDVPTKVTDRPAPIMPESFYREPIFPKLCDA